MSKFIGVLFIIVFSLAPYSLLAQQSRQLGSYNTVYFEVPISDKWSVFNEDEFRGIGVFRKYYYHEVKAGVNYKYSKKLTLTMALGLYNTFNGGEAYENMEEKTDYRFWQQINYKQDFLNGSLEHRIRIEEVLNKNFRPSIRYRIQPKLPLNKKQLGTGALFIAVYDELFFQFDAPALRRNRIYGGLGYYFSKNISVQGGILRQTDYKSSAPAFAKNFFYLSGSFRL